MNDHAELSAIQLNQHLLSGGASRPLPTIPKFETLEEERLHRKQRLAVRFACSPNSDLTKVWRVISPRVILSLRIPSG